MTETPTDAPEPALAPAPATPVDLGFEPERLYHVTLSRPVMLLGVMHSPMYVNHIAGRFIAELGDAVIDATAV